MRSSDRYAIVEKSVKSTSQRVPLKIKGHVPDLGVSWKTCSLPNIQSESLEMFQPILVSSKTNWFLLSFLLQYHSCHTNANAFVNTFSTGTTPEAVPKAKPSNLHLIHTFGTLTLTTLGLWKLQQASSKQASAGMIVK